MQIVPFKVLYASSEEKRYSSTELNEHSPTVRGWRSAKNSIFPQDIVLVLNEPQILNRLQILPHQFLIPEQIEIWYSEDDVCDYNHIKWLMLGSVTFLSNEKSKFQSRELKSVDVPFCLAKFIKLSITKNYQNPHNQFDQVSIMAVNILGAKVMKTTTLGVSPFNDSHYQSPYDDLSFTMYCDKEVVNLIRLLDAKKHQAVNVERFEYARRLKEAISRLKKIGEQLGKLCLEKRIAIDNEHFERAIQKKNQIDAIRDQYQQEILIEQLLEKNGLILDNDDFIGDAPNVDIDFTTQSTSAIPNDQDNDNCSKSPSELKPIKSPNIEYISLPKTRNGSIRRRIKSIDDNSKSLYESNDDRTLPTLMKHSQTEEYLGNFQTVPDYKPKCKLNEKDRRQTSLSILVFGNELVEKFFSKHYSDKEEGLIILRKTLQNFSTDEKSVKDNQKCKEIQNANRLTRASVFLLHRTLRDKVFSVYSLTNEIIRILFGEFMPNGKVSQPEIIRTVDKLLPELLTKSGDASTRVHHMAMHTILSLAESPVLKQVHTVPVLLSRPINSGVHPRLSLSRMEMVEQLILSQGILKEKQSGLSCRTLLDFGLSGLHQPSEPVRKVAERILVQVYRKSPQLVRKQLPPDDDITRRNLLYRHLFKRFDAIDLEKKLELLQQSMSNGIHLGLDNDNVVTETNSLSSRSDDNFRSREAGSSL